MSRLAGFTLVLSAVACTPQTNLSSAGNGPADAGTGPAVTLVEPTPGATVPQNLAAVVLRVSAPLVEDGASLELRPSTGAALSLAPMGAVDCTGAGHCYAFAPAAPVPPGHYLVAAPAGARFEDGRPLPTAAAGAFTVGAELDETPPAIDPPLLETVGDCVRIRFATDEPARASVVVRAGGVEQVLAAGEGSTIFDLATRLPRLPAGAPGELVVRAVDWAGNHAESGPLPMTVPPVEPPLAITEVLANPAGPEATQEFVELRNLGLEPIALDGMQIEDATGGDPLPAGTLAPGAFAVIVPVAFNVLDGRDPPPRTTALLLRVEGRIGRDGISNAGEVVRLRAKTGEVLSRYGGWVDNSASSWTGHSVQRQPQDACDGPAAWTTHPQGPTPGW